MELGEKGAGWEMHWRGFYSFGEVAAYCCDLGLTVFTSRRYLADYGLGGGVEFEEGGNEVDLKSAETSNEYIEHFLEFLVSVGQSETVLDIIKPVT